MVMDNYLRAIATEIKSIFPHIEVHDEQYEQGLNKPYFYLYQSTGNTNGLLMDRQDRTIRYSLVFFPDESGRVNEQCREVSKRLFDEFNFIPLIKLRPLDKEGNIYQGVLNFEFKLRYIARLDKSKLDLPKMQSFESHQDLKE